MSKRTPVFDVTQPIGETNIPSDPTKTPPKPASSVEDYLDIAPEIDRDEAAANVEKILFGQLFGNIKLQAHQLTALSTLSRKFVEQAATLKIEPDIIDTETLLSDAFQSNIESFTELTEKAEEYFVIELERRKQLDDSMQEIAAAERIDGHQPDLTAGGALAPFNPTDEESNPYSQGETLLRRSNGALPDAIDGFQEIDPQGTNVSPPRVDRLDEVSLLQGDGLQPPPVSTFIPHRSR